MSQFDRKRRLYRSEEGRMISGVAAGIAEYFDVDPTVVRVLWVAAALIIPPLAPGLLLLYVALALIIPPAPTAE
ncbi:MAG: PspC domain-containing protein [Chloroflexi bacterium]|nr:PspC domain-containing protein [Chloroflexota bacterium]